jgi:hypothetical protein
VLTKTEVPIVIVHCEDASLVFARRGTPMEDGPLSSNPGSSAKFFGQNVNVTLETTMALANK